MRPITATGTSVSVVLVCFNQEAFIQEAVQSILNQACDPVDILISDDCSTDRTFEVACDTVATYRGPHRVRLNRNDRNMGISAHYTKCALSMHSEWVTVAAGDDISFPQRVRTVTEMLKRYPSVDGIGSGVEVIDADGKNISQRSTARSFLDALMNCIKPRIVTNQHHSPKERIDSYLIEGTPWLNGATAVWRRRLITDFPPIVPDAPEDAVLRLRAAIGGGVAISRQPLVKYRTHAANAWNMRSDGVALEQVAVLRARQKKIGSAALEQHITDLEFAARNGRLSSATAAHGVALIGPLLARVSAW